MSKYTGPNIHADSKEMAETLDKLGQAIHSYKSQIRVATVLSDKREVMPRHNFGEQVEKQVIVLLFAIENDKKELAMKICERLLGPEFFSQDFVGFGNLPRSKYRRIYEKVEDMLDDLHQISKIRTDNLHRFLAEVRASGIWREVL